MSTPGETFNVDLGRLANPEYFTGPIDISGQDIKLLKTQLRTMLVIRKVEEKLGDMMTSGKIVCPCHLAIGQEATAVGVSANLRPTDRIFGTHRSHSHFLALGASAESLFAETLGKLTGCSRGMGGSMHLHDQKTGFLGSVPIVAATVPMAVGAGLAASMDKKSDTDVGVAYFGDGTTEEGVVHESMNLASKFKLPVLFVVENNLFSSHLHINLRQPADSVARYAAAHRLNYEVVEGNDIVAVSQATERLLKKARNGEGAGFLESVTYRWRGHVGPREDTDVGLKRSGELVLWKRRDPVRRLKEALISASQLSEADYLKLDNEVAEHIESSWRRAEDAPYPPLENLLNHVWAETSGSVKTGMK